MSAVPPTGAPAGAQEQGGEKTGHPVQPCETVQGRLKTIGRRVAALQQSLSEADVARVAEDTALVSEAWSLLLELRPFLFLACDEHSPHAMARDPVAVAFRTKERKRDLHHVGLALRLYSTLVRMTIAIPYAALHTSLVLLSLLPQLTHNTHLVGFTGERYMDLLRHHLLCVAAVDHGAFTELIRELLRSVVTPMLAAAAHAHHYAHEKTCTLRVCTLTAAQLEHHAAVLSLSTTDDAEALFNAKLVVSNEPEVKAVLTSVGALLTHLATEQVLTSCLTTDTVTPLVDVSLTLVEADCQNGTRHTGVVGHKRRREEEDRVESQRPDGSGGSADVSGSDIRVGLALLRALAENRLLSVTVHGSKLLSALLCLYSNVSHQRFTQCTDDSCALDSSLFLIDVLEDSTSADCDWGVVLFGSTDGSSPGASPLPYNDFLRRWWYTVFQQHESLCTRLAGRTSLSGEAPQAVTDDGDDPLPACLENVYRLQRLFNAAVVSAGHTAPETTAAHVRRAASAAGVPTEAIRGCLCARLPLRWYETHERLNGSQCPEQEMWSLLPFGSTLFSAVVSSLTALKESLSVSDFQLARAHGYAIMALHFHRHVQERKSGGEEDCVEFGEWCDEQLAALPPPIGTLQHSLVHLSDIISECVHALLHHPEPQLPSLLSAMTLLLRVSRVVENHDSTASVALAVLRAVDGHLTHSKTALLRASPMTWRALLRQAVWQLPSHPLSTDGYAVIADEETQGGQATSDPQSHASGTLRHLLMVLQRSTPAGREARSFCEAGLLRGLALRTTRTLTVLAQATRLSLAALQHQASSDVNNTHTNKRANRVRRAQQELHRYAGSLALVLQDAVPILAFLVTNFPASTASVPTHGKVTETEASYTQENEPHAGAQQKNMGTDGSLSFLVALAGAVLLAREWVVQAPSTRVFFDVPALVEPIGATAANSLTAVVDVDDEEGSSDSEVAVAATEGQTSGKSPIAPLTRFPEQLTSLAVDGITALSAQLRTLESLPQPTPTSTTRAKVLRRQLACLAMLAPADNRTDGLFTSDEALCGAAGDEDDDDMTKSLLSLALATSLQQRENHLDVSRQTAGSVVITLRDTVPPTTQEATLERGKLRVLRLLFSGSGAVTTVTNTMTELAPKISAALAGVDGSALMDCLTIPADPTRQRSIAWEEMADNVLTCCASAWPAPTVPLPPSMDLRASLVDVACVAARSLSWRPEDILRRTPHIVTSDFFIAVCQQFDGASPAVALRTTMDVVVPKLVFHEGWSVTDVEHAVAELEAISDGPVANACLEPALAHVLLHHGASPPAAMIHFNRLFAYLQLPLRELPRICSNCVPLTVLHLLSATGEAQLDAWKQQEHHPKDGEALHAVESVSFSFLSLGLRQLTSLAESAPTEEDVLSSLTNPVSALVGSQAVVTHGFDVLDRLMKCMGVVLTQSTVESPEPQLKMSSHVSVHTGCRWLLALASFLRFLGSHTTLMMAKLPPILEACCTIAGLVRVACAVWMEMVLQCTDEYLREHAATIVVDLVGLELYAASMDSVALTTLSCAIERVHARSAELPFWQSYFKVLGGLSHLVARVQHRAEEADAAMKIASAPGGRKTDDGRSRASARKSASVAIRDHNAQSNADAIASGFSFIMNTSSTKCKAIFVRALHRFLSEADVTTLHEMTEAATTHPQLIPTLLQCSRELEPADVLDALSCVGMIGAVAPQTVSLSSTTAAEKDSEDGATLSPAPPPAVPLSRLAVDTALQWRRLAFVLLSEYCTRALANTSDPAIYDRAGYAVQELLLLFARRERSAANGPQLLKGDVLHVDELERYSWWHDLDARSKQLLEGFTTTRYAAHRHTPSEPTYPAYRPGMPYAQWLHALFKSLAPMCDNKFSQMMAALRNVSRRDVGLVTFLIPHMIANILENSLLDSPESLASVDAVVDEVNTLLTAAVHGAEGGKNDVLSLRSQSALESGVAAPVRVNGLRVDEHVQFILRTLEELQQVRWSLLRIGRRLEPPPPHWSVSEEMCLKLADQYRDFLARVPASKKALAAMDIGSNMRALRCLESQARLHAVAVESKDVPLQRIFAALGDRDSAKSIHRLMRGLSPEKAAFSYENSGEWQQAIQNCELVLQHEPHSVAHQFTALRCMRQLGQLHFMSRYAQALLEEAQKLFESGSVGVITAARGQDRSDKAPSGGVGRREKPACLPESVATLQNYANEAAWRLGEWDKVQCFEELPASLAAPVAQWVKLLHGRSTSDAVARATYAQRQKLAPIIQRTCRENYTQCYPYVAMLHTLADLDGASKLIDAEGTSGEASRRLLVDTLHARLQVTDVSLEAREPMLSIHRAIFSALGLQREVSGTWLDHAQLLRDAGFPEAALIAARQSFLADPSPQSSYYTLAAELLYEMKAPMQAVEFVSEHVSDDRLPASLRADLQVKMTNWRLETGSQSKDEVIGSYRAALAFQETERGHHHLALFLDKLYTVNVDNVETEMKGIRTVDNVAVDVHNAKMLQLIEDYAAPAVAEYAHALVDGHETVSVSLPRLLTLWLDSAATLNALKRPPSRSAIDAERLLKSLNRSMEVFFFDKTRCVAPQILVTALPQLLSHVCHPCAAVVTIITRAVVSLMTHFPQQCLWMVMPIAFSTQPGRSKVVKQHIIAPFDALHASHKTILQQAYDIFVALIELCNCPASTFANNAKLTKQPFIQKLEPILESAKFIVPTMANMSPRITAADLSDVFPSSPTFLRFADRVDVMSSLQKPKRVWVHTNEGTTVSFLCKSKDEPRKDIRMMEVASLMNTFFLKDPAARRRNFGLRRYAIAALTDDCALIEWVNNISTLRNVATQCYGLDGSGVRISQIKAWQAKVENKSLTKLDMFKRHILPAAPPVLHQWFDATFASNDRWYQARNLFTQSTALWSIAGHVVGLGDRHGENLMVDMRAGEMLHVDFACLFDKGETLDVPERVRFRLTQNIVDGMGVLGTEGQFRANCEIALRCQMQNKNAVMSIVETLLHDPLVEWAQKSGRPSVNPKRLIQRVSRRLDGFLDLYTVPPESDTMALNVEGQVSKLISHSSALENLCEMYIWWMAWL